MSQPKEDVTDYDRLLYLVAEMLTHGTTRRNMRRSDAGATGTVYVRRARLQALVREVDRTHPGWLDAIWQSRSES